MRKRSIEPEIMDDLNISGEVVFQTLRELETINRTLGGNSVSISAFKRLLQHHNSISLVDLGCGGGDMLKQMADWSRKMDKEVSLVGLDANPNIVNYATDHINGYQEISFESINVLSPEFRERNFDIVHACLFTHHFDEDQLVAMFRSWKEQARLGVIVNDLHRHPIAYYAIKLITRLFSRSSMVKYDAPLSVKRGFKKSELLVILEKAGIKDYHLSWKWAFRWRLIFGDSISH